MGFSVLRGNKMVTKAEFLNTPATAYWDNQKEWYFIGDAGTFVWSDPDYGGTNVVQQTNMTLDEWKATLSVGEIKKKGYSKPLTWVLVSCSFVGSQKTITAREMRDRLLAGLNREPSLSSYPLEHIKEGMRVKSLHTSNFGTIVMVDKLKACRNNGSIGMIEIKWDNHERNSLQSYYDPEYPKNEQPYSKVVIVDGEQK